MNNIYMNVMGLLEDNNQDHILKYMDKVEGSAQEKLIEQISSLDFAQLNDLYNISMRLRSEVKDSCFIEHISFTDKYKMPKEKYEKCLEEGEKILKNGEYAVVTMAGGQGTRLGHKGPKGSFVIDVMPKPKYLFEIIADGIKSANEKYGIVLPWYIMTSEENNDETISFFEKQDYFGYSKENIMFFKQGNLPLLNQDGKLLISDNNLIKEAADGNGCIYKAMKKSGVIEDMKKRNVKWIFIGAVDNVLLNMTDPILVGLTSLDGNLIGSKTVAKANPEEKVGVFCKKNGVPSVIEYTELPEEMAKETDEEDELLFGEAHIMCNLYHIDAIEKISNERLPYHSANKKAEYIDEKGNLVKPAQPNAFKYEAFIFDGFNFFDNITLLRGRRQEDFAPVKNASGVDSPESAKELYNQFYMKDKKISKVYTY